MHCAVTGLVSHSDTVTGNATPPVSGEAVIIPAMPTFTVATAKTPKPVFGSMVTMPSWLWVAARATMSGTGVAELDSSSVFTPTIVATGTVLLPVNANVTSVGPNGALGVTAITKHAGAPGGMLTGTFGPPVTAFVLQLVALYVKAAGTLLVSAMPVAQATVDPVFMIVANAVAAVPTVTDRLAGRIAATAVVCGGSGRHSGNTAMASIQICVSPTAVAVFDFTSIVASIVLGDSYIDDTPAHSTPVA